MVSPPRVSVSPLLQWLLPLQLRTSHPKCKRRTHTAPWCTQQAAHRNYEITLIWISTTNDTYTKTSTSTHTCWHTHSCLQDRIIKTLIERESIILMIFMHILANTNWLIKRYCLFSPFHVTFSMDPFWNTCCSSQTTQYSLSVGILCSEYFIIC